VSKDSKEINSYRRNLGLKEFRSVLELKHYYYSHTELPDYFHSEVANCYLRKKHVADNNKKSQKSLKKTTVEFRGEVIDDKCPKSMYKAIMSFFLKVIAEMYEEYKKKHGK